MDIGEIVMSIVRGMYQLFGLEGMVGVLIGFILYAVYSKVSSQIFKVVVILVFVLIVWAVAYYIMNGRPVDIGPANETLHQMLNTYSSNVTNGSVR